MSLEKTILVVDDEIEMRIALQKSLEKCGYKVELAHNVETALNKLTASSYHLVLTDMTMPKQSGMEILNYIQTENLNLPVIMITAHGTIAIAVEAMKKGAFDFVEKPFNFDTLIFLVERALLDKTNPKQIEKQDGTEQKIVHTTATDGSSFICREIITQNKDFKKILEMTRTVADTNSTVLIEAESGTGKELLARYLHFHSSRKNAPFVAVNCAALPDTLLESELFGHKKGSFTGAINDHKGKFEQANTGTIFLDEVSEMESALQSKLLRVIQEKQVVRLGDSKEINLDVRIIATTNRVLKKCVKEGSFREDLYFRLNVIPLTIPPLRDRKDDLEVLIEHFIEKYGEQNQKNSLELETDAKKILVHYHWKGNVRELENVIERAVILSDGKKIISENLLLFSGNKKNEKS